MPSDLASQPLARAPKRKPPRPQPQRATGRPSLYRPEYCERVEALGRQGFSPAQIAAALNISKSALYEWAHASKEFADSLHRAKTFEQAFWETTGRKSLNRKHFQAQVWRTSMAARFKDDYTESSNRVDITLDLGGAIAEIEARRRPSDAKPVEVASSFAPLAEPEKPKG